MNFIFNIAAFSIGMSISPSFTILGESSNMTSDIPVEDYGNSTNLFPSNETDVSLPTVTSQRPHPDCSNAFKFWFATVGIGSVCLLGLLGNTLSILVLQKDSHNRVACFLLQALAFADNALLFLCLIMMSVLGLLPILKEADRFHFDWNLGLINKFLYQYGNPIADMSKCCTVWITVLLAINRYLAICKPFIVHEWSTPTRVRIQVVCVVMCCILFNIPRFFTMEIKQLGIKNPNTGETVLYVIYNSVFMTLFSVLLPLAILTVLNSRIVLEIRKINLRARNRIGSESVNEDNITRVMVMIILILLICHTPDSIRKIVEILVPFNKRGCHTPYYYTHLSCNLLIVLNSSVNFILYYFIRKGFRQALYSKLCGCFLKRHVVTRIPTKTTVISQSVKSFKVKQSRSCPELIDIDIRGDYKVIGNSGTDVNPRKISI